MDAQIENAIEIAWNPAADVNLKSQAIDFLNHLRTDPSAWQACLSLFIRLPRPSEVVRHLCLEVLNIAVQNPQLDSQSLNYIKESLLDYIRRTYGAGQDQNNSDTAHIQNKLTQTLTYLFASLYVSGWETFFDDFRTLAGDQSSIGTSNVPATILYLRILSSVHDEIADVLVSRSPEELKRNTALKDLVRARDARKISLSWQEILARWRQIDLAIVELCLKTVSRWVSWIDISLVVNELMLNVLLQIAGQQAIGSSDTSEGKIRDAAIDTFTEIVGKKMRPAEKIELLRFLNLGAVVGQLIASSPLSKARFTPTYDTDLAETVAKLVNTAVFDIVKVLDTDNIEEQTRQSANELLQIFVPYLLRFFADEYDEICSTVIPSLTDLLSYFRKVAKAQRSLPQEYSSMLPPILDAIIGKMKYDDTASWGEEGEQTDEAEFQELRKRLHVLQQTVAIIDEGLYMDTLSRVVANTFGKLGAENVTPNWRELDLALHEMYLFGELAVRNGGLYAKREPSSVASHRLIEMMSKMAESDVASFPHPAVQLQYMEICVRYCQFFEQNTSLIPRILENFVRLTHSDHIKVRLRSWYLFLRFVKPLRIHLGNVSQTVIQAISDLLAIKAEVPESNTSENDDDMTSEVDDQSADAKFNAQLYLFEAIGCISSPPSVPVENKILFAQSVINPLFADMDQNLGSAKNGDAQAILQIHHDIEALGTLARGFSDWQPGVKAGAAPPPSEVSGEFERAAEGILVALESLKSSMDIRSAARFSFSRLLGVLGSRVLQQLPRWIDGLLSQNSTNDEMATFLRLLNQVIFAFKAEIFGILDALLTPLIQRTLAGLAKPVEGTDDEIQLSELKREYLHFILCVLNQDLGAVFVSASNQAIFETIITTIEHFARDAADLPNARLAVTVMTRMTAIWGGSDFDRIAIERFSPLSWAIPRSPRFNGVKDPLTKAVIVEVAALQGEIFKKSGQLYLESLKRELTDMGVNQQGVEEYISALTTQREKGFRQFLLQFVGRGTGG